MIISSAPLRVSFIGGGTDYENFYRELGGAFIGTAIRSRVYVVVNALSPLSRESIRFTYRQTESVSSSAELKHPVMRQVLRLFGIERGINIATMADLPGNSGLGSSSAFTLAAINACAEFTGARMTTSEKIEESINIERRILGEAGGIQDYYHSTYGSLRTYLINRDGAVSSTNHFDELLNEILKTRTILLRIGEFRESKLAAEVTRESINNEERRIALLRNLEGALELNEKLCSEVEAEKKYKELCNAVNLNWQNKIIFQSVHNEEIVTSTKFLASKGAEAFKVCGAGKSGFLYVMFKDEVPFEIRNSKSAVSLEISNTGLITHHVSV